MILWSALLGMSFASCFVADANPTGGAVVQGHAAVTGQGTSQVNINQTSAAAQINWSTFNVGSGETVNFYQPSSSSVTWNRINDVNASQILGDINANGFVVLQNQNGIFIGGSATINTHGLILTTAPSPPPNFSGGGPWSFAAPPPTAKIVNYGQINVAGGSPAYLIASDIENDGIISAPGGKIGLYAGEKVLVSSSPDARGLSAELTLPQGSVNNNGTLVADAGTIAAQAQVVNQNGLVQANSVQDVNGTIELLASDSLNLGANSMISAKGDTQGVSAGGSVTIKSGNTFSDLAGSTIDISGGAQGGNGGQAEISAPEMNAINSTINGQAAGGYINGVLTIDPLNILLASSSSDPNAQYSGTVNPNDPPASGTLILNVNDFASTLSQIDLQALNNIELSTVWTLAGQTVPANFSLSAGNSIIFDNGAGLQAGKNWNVTLTAGTAFSGTTPVAGNDGIYLNGNAFLQANNGSVNLWAANEIILGSGGVRTIGGGNIEATAEYGDVNTGTSTSGLNYYGNGNGSSTKPYYTAFQLNGSGSSQTINFNASTLGGISTAAGGDVTINAGGDVISFPATQVAASDPGTGCFGPEAGNLTINAGGSVYGNFMEINGIGTINAGGDIGNSVRNVALSLASGSWNLNALGNIYLQEVRNPNGVFNNTTTGLAKKASAGNHLFDYSAEASVSLTAGDGVYITGNDLPRPNGAVPMLLPPTVIIDAGADGVTLDRPTATDGSGFNDVTLFDYDLTLFPSAFGNLEITTTGGGSLISGNTDGSYVTLVMSDSAQTRWSISSSGLQPFSVGDDAAVPAELNNNQPVTLNISGSMENLILYLSKFGSLNIGGDMTGCSFYGENLKASQTTSLTVGGQIFNQGSFASITLDQSLNTLATDDHAPNTVNSWFTALLLAVDPGKLPTESLASIPASQLASYLNNALEFPGLNIGQSLSYDAGSRTLTAIGPLSSALVAALGQTLTVIRYGADGYPLLNSSGHFVTDTITLLPAADSSQVASLYTASQASSVLGTINGAYVCGGTGTFNVTANSISLGNSDGILSVGNGSVGGRSYAFLTPYITSGATIDVTAGFLEMPSSTIAALGGGDVNVTCTGEIPGSGGLSMDLGSPDLVPFDNTIMNDNGIGLGIYTSGGGNVNVTALGTINVDSSRIATFNGGNITIESLTGDVLAGSGDTAIPILVFSPSFAYPYEPIEYTFANGIVAETLLGASKYTGAATQPGNITVLTPEGNIESNGGGISQVALGAALSGTPTIDLYAGTPAGGDWTSKAPPVYVGNINVSGGGAIGGTINLFATGKISGHVVAIDKINIAAASISDLQALGRQVNVNSGSEGPGIQVVGLQGVTGVAAGNAISLPTSAATSSTSQAAAQNSTALATQQVTTDEGGDGDKNKKGKGPAIRKVGRVTVLLSSNNHPTGKHPVAFRAPRASGTVSQVADNTTPVPQKVVE